MNNDIFGKDVPAGFQSLMTNNREAMDAFLTHSEAERQAIVAGARDKRSRKEMRDYVNSIAGYEAPHPPVQL